MVKPIRHQSYFFCLSKNFDILDENQISLSKSKNSVGVEIFLQLIWLNLFLLLPDCWGDGAEDWTESYGLPSHRQALLHSVLLHCWPPQHWPHVSVLPDLVRQPLHHVYSRQVSFLFYFYIWGNPFNKI